MLTRELIFERIYKGSYKEWKVRNLFSDLMILADEFLAVDKLKGKELHKIYFIK